MGWSVYIGGRWSRPPVYALIVRSQVDPGVISGWHHHGNYSVYGYIASGTAKFESGPGGNDTLVIPKGDFFHVPPKTIHRDINPSQTEPQEVVIFFFGDGPMVINVDEPA